VEVGASILLERGKPASPLNGDLKVYRNLPGFHLAFGVIHLNVVMYRGISTGPASRLNTSQLFRPGQGIVWGPYTPNRYFYR